MYQALQAKKLVLVLATFILVTSAKEAQKVRVLDQVSYICYLVQFQKDKSKDILALLDFRSKGNAMTPAYAAQLGLKVRKTNTGTQKFDRCSLATYGMVIATFQAFDKVGCFWFFQETFLVANISMEVILGMLFRTFNNAVIQFAEKKLI